MAVFDSESGTRESLVNGMDGSGRPLPNGLWLDGQKVSNNVVALDLAKMSAVWIAGTPRNYKPALQWQITGERVVATATVSSDNSVVVTQVRQDDPSPSAPQVVVRSADDGAELGGGLMQDFTILADARADNNGDNNGGVTAVGVAGPTLIAVDALTGASRWQIRPESLGFAAEDVQGMNVLADLLVVRTESDLWALDPQDGSLRWQLERSFDQSLLVNHDVTPLTQAGERLVIARRSEVPRRRRRRPAVGNPTGDRPALPSARSRHARGCRRNRGRRNR